MAYEMVMPYHLHMPSYFLETFTEYPMGAAKEIKITDSFSVPAFAKVTVNPRTEGAYFVFGLSF